MHRLYIVAAAALILGACGKEKTPVSDTNPATAPAAAAGGPLTPDAGGKVITIELASDEKGNYFTPNAVKAKTGDVLRYTLKTGVHNVHFLADSNPGKAGLPPASDMLQLPGQTYDVKVAFAPGTYYFQCDPHAALGMQAHLTVTK